MCHNVCMSSYLTAKSGSHRTKLGPPHVYPWLTLTQGETYFVPVSGGVQAMAIYQAVRRRNADNVQRGRPERFSAPNERVRHPVTGEACYRVVRVV